MGKRLSQKTWKDLPPGRAIVYRHGENLWVARTRTLGVTCTSQAEAMNEARLLVWEAS